MHFGLLSRRPVAATAVSISDIAKDQTVFQRVGSSKQITVSGTSNGSHVVVQAIDANSSAIVATSERIRVVGGVFSGALTVPQGGWYKLKAACAKASGVTSVGSSKFGVGVVVGMIGQSNMNGMKSAVDAYPLGLSTAVEYESSVFRRIGNINDAFPANTLYPTYSTWSNVGNRADGYVYFGNLLAAGLGVPVCLIGRAQNGTSITMWQSSQANMNTFASAITEAGGDMEMCLWLQGESDALAMSKETYKTNLAGVHNAARAITGRSADDFHFGVISLGPGSYAGSVEGDFGKIRAGQAEYAESNTGAFYATAAHDAVTADGVHMTGEGLGRIGRRAALSAVGNLTGSNKSGPRIVSASRSGNVVTLTVQHRGGTALIDGAGGSGSELTGFKVFDNGTEVTISGTAISSQTTIQLTLSATPTGAVTVSYGMANCPHGTTTTVTLASAVYDNQPVYGLSVGQLLQPLQSLAVS